MSVLLRHACASLALTAVALAATAVIATPTAEAAGFADTASASYGDAVQVLADKGVVQGCTDDEFCPSEPLTRGQIATVLVSALELPAADNDHFDDDDGSVHEHSIDALAEAAITSGCTDSTFCPDDLITRGQIASMLVRAFDPPGTDEVFFDDVSGRHQRAVARLADAGIVAGCADPLTAFCPEDPVLRWHSAVYVARSLGLAERVDLTSLEERREEQAAIEAEEQRRLEEERQRLEEEQRRLEEERRRREDEQRLAAQEERYAVWDRLAECESGGNWSINTGIGYYGGLQFSLSSWRAVGGSGYPHQHSREEQIARAERLLDLQGWGAWPACTRKLGYR